MLGLFCILKFSAFNCFEEMRNEEFRSSRVKKETKLNLGKDLQRNMQVKFLNEEDPKPK